MLVGTGEEHNELYYFKPAPATALQSSNPISFDTWHQHLGHPSLHNIPHFISLPKIIEHCDACNHGKHTRLPFQLVVNKSLMP